MRVSRLRILLAAPVMTALIFALPAASRAQSGSEASGQSSRMAPASGNNGPANNGTGTSGSLDHDAGSHSSTVTPATMGTGGGNTGAAGPKESDPALGGGSQAPK